jgi:hypothetical protein
MSNGTRPAVLVTELLSGDGPFVRMADAFLASVCAGCNRTVPRDGGHHQDGFYCPACWIRAAGLR